MPHDPSDAFPFFRCLLSEWIKISVSSISIDAFFASSLYIVYESFVRKHWLVFVSSVAALSALALQPLAGSIFDVQQVPESNMANAFSLRTLGLDPDRFQLTAFLAAAGVSLEASSSKCRDLNTLTL